MYVKKWILDLLQNPPQKNNQHIFLLKKNESIPWSWQIYHIPIGKISQLTSNKPYKFIG